MLWLRRYGNGVVNPRKEWEGECNQNEENQSVFHNESLNLRRKVTFYSHEYEMGIWILARELHWVNADLKTQRGHSPADNASKRCLSNGHTRGTDPMSAIPLSLNERLTKSVLERTGRRVSGLAVKLESGLVILSGRTGSFYVKQLALSGIRDLLPNAPLRNEIAVVY